MQKFQAVSTRDSMTPVCVRFRCWLRSGPAGCPSPLWPPSARGGSGRGSSPPDSRSSPWTLPMDRTETGTPLSTTQTSTECSSGWVSNNSGVDLWLKKKEKKRLYFWEEELKLELSRLKENHKFKFKLDMEIKLWRSQHVWVLKLKKNLVD